MRYRCDTDVKNEKSGIGQNRAYNFNACEGSKLDGKALEARFPTILITP